MFGRSRLAFCLSLLRKLIFGTPLRALIFNCSPYGIKWKASFSGAHGFTHKVDPDRPCKWKSNIAEKHWNCNMHFACTCACFKHFSPPFGTPNTHRQIAEACTGAGELHVVISSILMNVAFPLAGPVRIDFKHKSARTQKECISSNWMRIAMKNSSPREAPQNEFLDKL